jgi:ABC-type dipeptide/oligopeptide/nickel transport system permease component
MLRFIVRRLGAVPIVLFGVSFFIFLLAHLAPGDATTALTGPFASEAIRQKFRIELGLDRPFPVQYAKWLQHVSAGDLGTSIANRRAVADLVFPKFGNTAILALAAAVIAYVAGFLAGMYAAAHRFTASDRIGTSVALVLGNTPPYWLGLLLAFLFALHWRLLPATGMINMASGGGFWDVARHLVLPAVTAAAAPAAIIAQMVRASMLEVMSQNYVKVARAKGIPRRTILWRHALRNALPPIITICGLQLGYLFGGVLFVEVIFAWPGIGAQLWQSIISRDLPTIQGAALLIGLVFILINLAVDVINALVDPKIRQSEGAVGA